MTSPTTRSPAPHARSLSLAVAVAVEVAAIAAATRAGAWLLFEPHASREVLAEPFAAIAWAALAAFCAGLLAPIAPKSWRLAVALVGAVAIAATQFGTRFEGGSVDVWRVLGAVAVAAVLALRLVQTVARPLMHAATTVVALAAATLLVSSVERRHTALHPHFESWRVIASVLETPAYHRALIEHPERPVALGTFATTRNTSQAGGPRPALLMAPPARVRIEIPYEWSDIDAELELAAGIGAESWKEVGRKRGIVFRARVADEVVFERVMVGGDYNGEALPNSTDSREWHFDRVRLGGVEEVVLEVETTDGSPVSAEFESGFANLLVTEPSSHRRELASRAAPSLVFIVIDTMRADGFDPALDGRTPNMAALAARGTTFERAFSASSWTWPSTASLLTVLTPLEHGVVDQSSNYLPERWLTLPEHLQSHGFTTAAWSMNPLVSRAKNFDQGFEDFAETQWERAHTIADDVCAWLERHRRHRFMLFLQFTDPHGPYEPPDDVRERFDLVDPPGYDSNALDMLHRRMGRHTAKEKELWPQWVAHAHELYRAEIHDVDRTVGRIVDQLARLGIDERTVVVLTSDHGEEFLEHGQFGHGMQLFDESTHVPLLVAGPGVPRDERRGAVVENRHLAPTLLRLLGVEQASNLVGPDLFDDESGAGALLSTAIGHWRGVGRRDLYGIRDESWLYLLGLERDGDKQNEGLFAIDESGMGANVARNQSDLVRVYRERVESWMEASRATRPAAFGSDRTTLEMLQRFGYADAPGEE